ncbi:MAG TPA: CNNM domain-containing protein, partial [Rhizomicrobium sp.]|nr:CNNM domain-containing protein [Rhizomicrobium sp.]
MDTIVLITFAPIALLLVFGGFFSGSETALTAVSRARMHQLESEGSRAARNVNLLVANRERMIGALLLGNTFVNILASSLATSILESRFGPRTVIVTTAVMTVLILIFAEVLPKTLAIARTDRFALTVATPVRYVVFLLAPVVNAVQFLVWRVLALFGVRRQDEELVEAHDEIRGTVNLHHSEGTVEREHRDMIGGILDLRELTIADVMIHRKSMVSVDM